MQKALNPKWQWETLKVENRLLLFILVIISYILSEKKKNQKNKDNFGNIVKNEIKAI